MTIEENSSNETQEFDLDQIVSEAYDKATAPAKDETADEVEIADDTAEIQDKETPDQGDVDKAKPAADKPQPLEPHSRWSAEDKAAFKALPREAQEIVLKRESDVEKTLTQKTQELAEQRKQYESFEQIMAPRRPAMQASGGEAAYMKQLFDITDYATRDPAGFVKWFAEQRGIDLGSNPAAVTPSDAALTAQQKRIEALEQERFQEKQQAEQSRIEAARKEIADFEVEKDSQGNLKRPYVNDVRAEMSALFKAGLVKDLQDAYDRAVYTKPEIRAKLLEEMKKSDEKARIEAAKSAAGKAQKAVGVKVKTNTPAIKGIPNGSWEENLASIVDSVMGA